MLYHYKHQVSNDGFTLQVFEPGTTIFVYNASYPSYSECQFSGDLIEDETPLSLGVMKSMDDCEGLAKFLIGNKILQPGDTIEPGVPGLKPAKSIELIAHEKGVDIPYAEEQLQAGIKVESEHSTDPVVQSAIARQHLDEDIDYYKKLSTVESKFADGGITDASVINRDYQALKEKIGEKKAKKYFEQVDRLINPNKNQVVEYRSNGVVTKQGDKFIFHALADMDMSTWRIAFTNDVTEQFNESPEERDVYQYMNEMRKEYKLKESWYNFIKSYLVKHDANTNVDEVMELAQKIADHDKKELELEHIAESIMYYNGRRTTNDPTFGRITIWQVEGFLKYGQFYNDNLFRLKEIGILPGKGSVDLLAAENLKKAWDEFFADYDKKEDAAKRILQVYFDRTMLHQGIDEKEGLGRDAINDLTRLLIRAKVKREKGYDVLEAIAETIQEKERIAETDPTPAPVKKKNEPAPIEKLTKQKEKYSDLVKAFKDLYGIDPIELWKKAEDIYKNGIKDGEHTQVIRSFTDSLNHAFVMIGGGDNAVDRTYMKDDLIVSLMTTPELPDIKLKKGDLIDPTVAKSFTGLVDFFEIVRDIKPEKNRISLFKDIVSKDDLRPAMTGVYHDVKNQKLVGTNAHIVCILPHKLTGENRIINIKTGKEIEAKYPDYNVVIPMDNPVRVKGVRIKEWIGKLNGMAKASRLCDRGNTISCCVQTEYSAQYFDPEYMLFISAFFLKLGIQEVDLEISSKATRGMILRASSMKDTMALIMPLYSEGADVPTSLFDYLNVPGATVGDEPKKKKVEEPVEEEVNAVESSIEEETQIIPEIIADNVAAESLVNNQKTANLPGEEKARLQSELVLYLVDKARTVYNNNKDFRKKVNAKGNKGRDSMYMFMSHWAEGWIKPLKVSAPDANDFSRFETIVTESKTANEAFEKVRALKDVPNATSIAFRNKYDPDHKLIPSEAFEKFYNEVKGISTSTDIKHQSLFGNEPSTPFTQQMVNIKNKYPNALVIVKDKEGEFYEAFGDDAKIISDVIGSTLNVKESGFKKTKFRYHSFDEYLPKLVKSGYKVAVVDEIPNGEFKGMSKRDTTVKRDIPHESPKQKTDAVQKTDNSGSKKSSKKEKPEKPKERSERAISQDKAIKAQHPGKRTSDDGNTYYEYRDNRSDDDRRKKLKKGGKLDRADKDYKYFVVNKNNKVISGFEYREDAVDMTKEVDEAMNAKVYTASFIKSKLGYDPYDYANWENLTAN